MYVYICLYIYMHIYVVLQEQQYYCFTNLKYHQERKKLFLVTF